LEGAPLIACWDRTDIAKNAFFAKSKKRSFVTKAYLASWRHNRK